MNKKVRFAILLIVFALDFYFGYIFGYEVHYLPAIYSPVTEVHVETLYNETCYVKLLAYCIKHPTVMLMIEISPSDDNLTKSRIIELRKEVSNAFGLHVHIAVDPEIADVSYNEQYRLIKHGVDFLQSINITVTDFAPGFWAFDDNTVKACANLGLTRFHVWSPRANNHYFNYNLGCQLVTVRNYLHDWQL
jgi:hypothetical protein